jgi:two-component system, NtrC family, response regulator AtoC
LTWSNSRIFQKNTSCRLAHPEVDEDSPSNSGANRRGAFGRGNLGVRATSFERHARRAERFVKLAVVLVASFSRIATSIRTPYDRVPVVDSASDLAFRCVVGREFQVFRLPARGTVTIGRGSECELRLLERGVSRQHARVHVAAELWVEDLGSSNGTYISGSDDSEEEEGTTHYARRRVGPGQRERLVVGDILHVGAAMCVLERYSARRKGPSDGEAPFVADITMQNIYAMAEKIADTPLSVLVLGETGVGKEVLAATIVCYSRRRSKPYLRLNCAAFQESLLESELFGYERGAFTGALKAKPGLFEAADGGTVFLDEVAEIPPTTQVKLLRVLEVGQVQRIGALQPRPIDVRFISATNRNIEDEVRAGRFREDLYFRLNGVTLYIPALRERRSEILPLAKKFIARACATMGKSEVPELAESAADLLTRHGWRGNIRELKNVVERAVALCGQGPILPEHLPSGVVSSRADPVVNREVAIGLVEEDAPTLPRHNLGTSPTLPPAAPDPERELILRALEECAGNQTRAAKLLGISRTTLVARLDQYGVPRPRK